MSDQSETAQVSLADESADAGLNETDVVVPEQLQAAQQDDADRAQNAGDDADAQAAYVTDSSQAAAQYDQDKAAASRDYDNWLATAGITLAQTLAVAEESYLDWEPGGPPQIDLGAADAAANATY